MWSKVLLATVSYSEMFYQQTRVSIGLLSPGAYQEPWNGVIKRLRMIFTDPNS